MADSPNPQPRPSRLPTAEKAAPLAENPVLCCAPLRSISLSDETAEELANVLKALADPVRLKLVSFISSYGEACACDFGNIIDKSQPTISHHLSILVKAGILKRTQHGKWAWFSVETAQLAAVSKALQ